MERCAQWPVLAATTDRMPPQRQSVATCVPVALLQSAWGGALQQSRLSAGDRRRQDAGRRCRARGRAGDGR